MFLLIFLLVVGTLSEEHRPPRDRQFQIQGVFVEETRLERTKRQFQGFSQQRVAPNGVQPQPYILPNSQIPQQQQQQVFQFPQRQRIFHDIPGYGTEPVRPSQTIVGPAAFPQLKYNPPAQTQPQQAYVDFSGSRYYYPPRQPFPLPKCFHNPAGYVCCNQRLNDLIVETYTELDKRPKFHTCNVNALATHLQVRAEKHFNTTFETIAAYDDFAQKIHFKSDMVCKVEMGGKFMLAYATVKNVNNQFLRPLPGHAGPANLLKSHVKSHVLVV